MVTLIFKVTFLVDLMANPLYRIVCLFFTPAGIFNTNFWLLSVMKNRSQPVIASFKEIETDD